VDKLLIFDPEDKYGRHFFRSDELVSSVKTADHYDWSPEVRDIVSKIKPDSKKVVVLLNAMGAGEYYGPNGRGDYFRETELLDNYHTFERLAHVFKFHVNKDPKNSFGDVLAGVYNPRMHRVELVISVNREKAPDIAGDIDKGKFPSVSMGCKVMHDVCSVCGQVNKTVSQYCDHLKHHMGTILDDGRQVYADNVKPKFFDISFVPVGADRTARVLRKVASWGNIPSAMLWEAYNKLNRKRSIKMATNFPWHKLMDCEKDLPIPKKMTKEGFWQIVSSYVKLGIMPTLREFAGMAKAAGVGEDDMVDIDFYSEVEFPKLAAVMPYRSAMSPYLDNRIVDAASKTALDPSGVRISLVSNGSSLLVKRDPESPWVGIVDRGSSQAGAEKIGSSVSYARMYSNFADQSLEYLHDKLDESGFSYSASRVSGDMKESELTPKNQIGMEKFASSLGSEVILSDVTSTLKKEFLCRLGTVL
jgi:hypothetical protein